MNFRKTTWEEFIPSPSSDITAQLFLFGVRDVVCVSEKSERNRDEFVFAFPINQWLSSTSSTVSSTDRAEYDVVIHEIPIQASTTGHRSTPCICERQRETQRQRQRQRESERERERDRERERERETERETET